jgi:hypothetical protein
MKTTLLILLLFSISTSTGLYAQRKKETATQNKGTAKKSSHTKKNIVWYNNAPPIAKNDNLKY